MMFAEIRVHIKRYLTCAWHDDIGWTDGWDADIIRYTGYPPGRDIAEQAPGDPGGNLGFHFGGPHESGINCVWGDGHVSNINYDVDPYNFNLMGHRADGQVMVDP